MSKKSGASLSANLVAVKGTAAPASDMAVRGMASTSASLPASDSEEFASSASTSEGHAGGAPLNFRVPEAFRREFKVYAAKHGLKLNELLKLSFEAYRRTNGE